MHLLGLVVALASCPALVGGVANELNAIFSLAELHGVAFLVFLEEGVDARATGIISSVKESSRTKRMSAAADVRTASTRTDDLFGGRTMAVLRGSPDAFADVFSRVRNRGDVVWVLLGDSSAINSTAEHVPFNARVLRVRSDGNRIHVQELHGSRVDSFDVDPNRQQRRKMNLRGSVLRVGVPREDDTERSAGRQNRFFATLDTYHSAIFDLVAENVNFRKKYVTFTGGEPPFVSSNGTYTGFFRMVLEDDVDVSIASFVVAEKRLGDFDFIWPTFTLQTMMYLRKDALGMHWLSDVPFDASMWLLTLLWIILTGASLYACERLAGRVPSAARQSISHAVLKVLQLACCQGASEISASVPSRILHSATLLVGILLFNLYSATVVSYLTVEDLNLPFADLDGFFANGKYRLMANADGFAIYFFKFEMSQAGHERSRYLLGVDQLPKSTEEGAEKLCREDFLAYLELRESILSVAELNCELIEVPGPMFLQYFGLVLQKDSPYTEFMRISLKRLYELGIMHKMSYQLKRSLAVRDLHSSAGYEAVAVQKIMVALLVVAAGVLLASLVLGLELRRGASPRERLADAVPATKVRADLNPSKFRQRILMRETAAVRAFQ